MQEQNQDREQEQEQYHEDGRECYEKDDEDKELELEMTRGFRDHEKARPQMGGYARETSRDSFSREARRWTKKRR